MRAVLPVRAICEMTFVPPTGSRAPTGTTSPSRPQPASTVAVCSSSSKRTSPVEPAPSSRPSSPTTASKMSPGGAACATSVATRRSAACSSASRASCSRVALLEIAVATSSVISASRSSTPSGSGVPFAISTLMWPQVSPSTTIGAPAAEPTPAPRPASTSVPAIDSATSSIRISSPARMRSFSASSEGSSHGQLEPAGNGFGPSPHVPTTVTLPSRSQRKIWTSRGRSICATSRAIAANTSADRRPGGHERRDAPE